MKYRYLRDVEIHGATHRKGEEHYVDALDRVVGSDDKSGKSLHVCVGHGEWHNLLVGEDVELLPGFYHEHFKPEPGSYYWWRRDSRKTWQVVCVEFDGHLMRTGSDVDIPPDDDGTFTGEFDEVNSPPQ